MRLHGHEPLYRSRYGKAGLEPWAARVLDWHRAGLDVRVHFDNRADGAALADAQTLLAIVSMGLAYV